MKFFLVSAKYQRGLIGGNDKISGFSTQAGKIAIDQIAKEFGGKIPDTEKDLQKIHGIGQKIGLLILEEVFQKIEVSSFGNNIFVLLQCFSLLFNFPGYSD